MQVKNAHHGYNLLKWYFAKDIEIPQDWDYGKCEDLCEFKKGKNPKEFFDEKKVNTLLYLSSDFLENGIMKFAKKEGMVQIEKSDIIMIGDGEGSGRVYFANEGALSSTFLRIKSKKKELLNDFLFYYLSNHYPTFKNTRYGSAIPHIDKFILNKLIIPIPIKSEQQKIFSILSNINYAIQNTNQHIEQIQRLKMGLMQKLFTKGIGHKKFKKVVWLFKKEIEIPEEWELIPFDEITNTYRYPTFYNIKYQNEGIPVLNIGNIDNKNWNLSTDLSNYQKIDKKTSELFPKTIVKENDLVLAVRGATIGKFALVPDILSGSNINANLLRIEIDHDLYDSVFFWYFSQTYQGKKGFRRLVANTAKETVQAGELKKWIILSPPLEEQKQIGAIISNVDSQITKEKLQQSNLEILKKELIKKLLTGKIRVKF